MSAPINAKGCVGQPDCTNQSEHSNRNHNPLLARLKAVIVWAACWGLMPAELAEWIIKRGGMHDA